MKLLYFLGLLSLVAIFGISYLLGLNFNFPKLPAGARNPNMHELAYYNAAISSLDTNFCEKISSKTYTSANFAVKRGYQIKLLKSECYFSTAIISKNSRLCTKVKPINSWISGGIGYTQPKCIADVLSDNTPKPTGISLPIEYIEKLITELGYSDNINKNSENYEYDIIRYWANIENDPDFLKRLEKLPNY